MDFVENKNLKNLKGGKADTELYIQIGIIAVLVLVIAFSAGKIYSSGTGLATRTGTVSASEIIPTGTPFYGKDLGFSYDDINPNDPKRADTAIRKFALIDQQVKLTGNDLERYIDLLYYQYNGMSCEYCCGARSIIFENGEMACGCAHSFAMRGLAKHLILNYPELSDDKILEEVGKFKVLFFPGIHEQKAAIMESYGLDVDYISLTTNEYRGIEQGQTTGGGMVGGC